MKYDFKSEKHQRKSLVARVKTAICIKWSRDRKWSRTANDLGPQMIPNRKWSPRGTANDPDRKIRNSIDLHIRGRLKNIYILDSTRCLHIYIIICGYISCCVGGPCFCGGWKTRFHYICLVLIARVGRWLGIFLRGKDYIYYLSCCTPSVMRECDKHFPKDHKLRKILIKISYGCMNNTKKIIDNHNKRILTVSIQTDDTAATTINNKTCNCRQKNECPLDGNCLQPSVIYQATVTRKDNNTTETYLGLTENETRYRNHTASFRHAKHSNSTELSKHIWTLKDNRIEHFISWRRVKATGLSEVTKRHLCRERNPWSDSWTAKETNSRKGNFLRVWIVRTTKRKGKALKNWAKKCLKFTVGYHVESSNTV